MYLELLHNLVEMPCLLVLVGQAGFHIGALVSDWLLGLSVYLKSTNQVVHRQLNSPHLFKITNVSNSKLLELTV